MARHSTQGHDTPREHDLATPGEEARDWQAVEDVARRFVEDLAERDRAFRRKGITIAGIEDRTEVAAAYWRMMQAVEAYEAKHGAPAERRRALHQILWPWLLRSRFWNRGCTKPHGYAGDYGIVELMYDMEDDPCADPTQPAILDCLDELAKTIHSVQDVWERRHFFRDLLYQEYLRRGGRLKVLDVATGGGRYLADFLGALETTDEVSITAVDQDAAALGFLRSQSLKPWQAQVTLLNTPIRRLAETDLGGPFDLVISAGLYDYLDDETGRALSSLLAAQLAPGGLFAFSNFHPADPSRSSKTWTADWHLIYRDPEACLALLPEDLERGTRLSRNGSLCYAWARRR